MPYPSTTSPAAVGEMILLLRSKGARRVIAGEMSGIEHVRLSEKGCKGSTRSLMQASGMAQEIAAAGGEIHCFEEAGWSAFYEDYPASGTSWKKPLMMPDILKEADHIVLMPRCGRHVLAGSTLGLKATVGYWRTDTRLEYHKNASTFHEKTAEANTVSTILNKQRLVLTAADKVLANFGPDKGYVLQPEQGIIIASESVASHDAVSLAWLIENMNNLPASQKNVIHDPNRNSLAVTIGNRVVVKWLGGFKNAILAENLKRYDINSVWDDRILGCFFKLTGGIPEISVEYTNDILPEPLKNRLAQMTAR
ncbi:MAG: DUF362 domain-containing protein [Spirochaetes bacterium]|nr:DUF362 domain-containing protein [Spirochaetota bacterium]